MGSFTIDPAAASTNLHGLAQVAMGQASPLQAQDPFSPQRTATTQGRTGRRPVWKPSPRQLRLAHLWRYFTATNYDGRALDWNGDACLDPLAREAAASTPHGYLSMGAGGTPPLRLRRPTAPYALPRLITSRFTALLFSSTRHPTLSERDVPGQRLNNIMQLLRVDAARQADIASLRCGGHLTKHV
jgi:hypothetical protein